MGVSCENICLMPLGVRSRTGSVRIHALGVGVGSGGLVILVIVEYLGVLVTGVVSSYAVSSLG